MLAVDMSELTGTMQSTRQRHGDQSQMDGRADFHTHPKSLHLAQMQLDEWRAFDQLRTASALLVVCLDLGSPAFMTTHQQQKQQQQQQQSEHAVLEAWINPSSLHNLHQRSTTVANSLMGQFQQLSGKLEIKPLVDCDIARLQRNCQQFRARAPDERVIFYYNGHGVPEPTADGSLWVFQRPPTGNGFMRNSNFTPVSAATLAGWIGAPCIYIWDCSNAMCIVRASERNASSRAREVARIRQVARAARISLQPGTVTHEQMVAAYTRLTALLTPQQASPHCPDSAQTQQLHGNVHIDPELVKLALLSPAHCENIHFAATQTDEKLPTNPALPADLFTSCLTTPVKAALWFWINKNPHIAKVTLDMCDLIPGTLQDRGSPLGELNWIITSITDTIAWSVLPHDQFRKLFRLDPAVASLFRNFILANHIMRHYNVCPQSCPEIPATHAHPLWETLDYEIDLCLQQLPRLISEKERQQRLEDKIKRSEEERRIRANRRRQRQSTSSGSTDFAGILDGINMLKFSGPQRIKLEIAGSFHPWSSHNRIDGYPDGSSDESSSESGSDSDGAEEFSHSQSKTTGYVPSSFFMNQLCAFEVWMQHAGAAVTQFTSTLGSDGAPVSLSTHRPQFLELPEQLAIVLQLLLSQKYRLNALMLLYRFINLGPWAVNQALLVGFFPYMCKLLSSNTIEIRELMVLIWARLIAVDPSLKADLVRSGGIDCFVAYLATNAQVQTKLEDDRAKVADSVVAASAFVLTMTCQDSHEARKICDARQLLSHIITLLQFPDNGTSERTVSRTWLIMCLAELWQDHPICKWKALTFASWNTSRTQQTSRVTSCAASRVASRSGSAEMCGAERNRTFSLDLLGDEAETGLVKIHNVQGLLLHISLHRSPVVRAAAVHAMGTLINDLAQLGDNPEVQAIARKAERQIHALLLQAASSGSPMVRCEVVRVIGSAVFASHMPQAIEAVAHVVSEELREHRRRQSQAGMLSEADLTHDLLVKLYKVLLKLSKDGHPDVSLLACKACDVLMQCYAHSQPCLASDSSLDSILEKVSSQSGMLNGSSRNSPEKTPLLLTPRSQTGFESLSAANLATIREDVQLSKSQDSVVPEPVNNRDRPDFASKAGEIEQAWLEWGRRELRENMCASTLLDWAGAHFTEFDISLFANVSGPLQSSAALVESRERNRRVDRMETSARAMSSQAGSMRWMDVRPVATTKDLATTAILHPLEPHAIVASRRGTVSVFDWELQAQVGHYGIGETAAIGSLHLVNPLGQAKLLVGTRDGKVRIFASHAPDFVPPAAGQAPAFPRPRLLTAFTALPWASLSINVGQGFGQTLASQTPRLKAQQPPALAASDSGLDAITQMPDEPEGCGLVTAWNQRSGILFAGGNDKEVRVWDIASEMCIEEIAVASMGGITCISHDGVSGNIFAVGNMNGLVRVMDRRLDARTGVVANWREHSPGRVCSVFMRPGQAEVVSASDNGDVKYWDLRQSQSLHTLQNTHPSQRLEYMVAHENAPVVMTASYSTINFWNQSRDNIGVVTTTEEHYGSLKSYMKSLAGYGNKESLTVRLSAAAIHTYLPVALLVSDNGQVSSIQPTNA
ncbi:Target of rapamycin complex 1 subunit kog1 [Coemansia sp. RSA 2711]|nr:Target of rapamycin complex 1 subunit kog1 [Coemansia sp. RSA 2711]